MRRVEEKCGGSHLIRPSAEKSAKTRPAVIVSNNAANTQLNRVQVVPLTSQTGRLYRSEALVTLRGEPRKAMADQLTTVSKLRLGQLIARLDSSEMAGVERAIKTQLGLS